MRSKIVGCCVCPQVTARAISAIASVPQTCWERSAAGNSLCDKTCDIRSVLVISLRFCHQQSFNLTVLSFLLDVCEPTYCHVLHTCESQVVYVPVDFLSQVLTESHFNHLAAPPSSYHPSNVGVMLFQVSIQSCALQQVACPPVL